MKSQSQREGQEGRASLRGGAATERGSEEGLLSWCQWDGQGWGGRPFRTNVYSVAV